MKQSCCNKIKPKMVFFLTFYTLINYLNIVIFFLNKYGVTWYWEPRTDFGTCTRTVEKLVATRH